MSTRRRQGGWSRRGRTGRFAYFDAQGRRITDERMLERIAGLAIPPAWTDVWIAPSERARIQATGIDAAGRKQYLYSDSHRAARERAKFDRLVAFGTSLPTLREHVATDLDERERYGFEWTSAVALTLVNRAWFRPGSERAARSARTYGVTTLTRRHVRIAGHKLTFSFRGKHRVLQRVSLVDDTLAHAVRGLLELPGGARVFRFTRDETLQPLTAPLLNRYLRERSDPRFSVKDFRTWGGTLSAAVSLAEHGPPSSEADARKALARAFRVVAEELGNTPAVARASYVSPVVVERFREGLTLAEHRPRRERVVSAGRGLTPEERALLSLLEAG